MKIWTSSSRPLPDSSCSVSAALVRQCMRWHWRLSGKFHTISTCSRNSLVIWTFFCDRLVSGTRLFGECLARGVQECWSFWRLFHGLFLRFRVSDSHLFGGGPAEKYRNLFWEMTSGAVSAFVCLRILGELHVSLRAGGPRTPRSTLFGARCLAR